MNKLLDALQLSISHLSVLDTTLEKANKATNPCAQRYKANLQEFNRLLDENIAIHQTLYNDDKRQMILADVLEYALLSRGANLLTDKESKSHYIKVILVFVNLLMSYEDMTSEVKLRKLFLRNLAKKIPQIGIEEHFDKLNAHTGMVGIKNTATEGANKITNKYFDTLLPKTAGGLWHELLVYIFMLRRDAGYIIPLLLHQRLIGLDSHLVPPDFLVIKDKHIFGVEVGSGKELQSSGFTLKTAIPTVSVNTIDSRTSDRCPICHKWIHFCDFVIGKFSNLDEQPLSKPEIKCIGKAEGEGCTKFTKEEIYEGKCPASKYARYPTKLIAHKFTDGLHYHYACVLKHLSVKGKKLLISQKDKTAIKTHYPYYSEGVPNFV